MEFVNQFVVPAPIDEAWKLLNDVPTIAPCLPGAEVLRNIDGGIHEGTVTVKVGPIKVGYSGIVTFTEVDHDQHTMALDARGAETSGKGSAAAVVRVNLTEKDADATLVEVFTDLQVTGRIAQFGRTVMADVGARIIGQFATNLEQLIGAGDSAPRHSPESAAASQATSPQAGHVPLSAGAHSSPASGGELDLLSLGLPLLKRAAPAVGALLVGLLVGRLLPRRHTPAGAPSNLAALYPLLLDLARQSRCPEDHRPR